MKGSTYKRCPCDKAGGKSKQGSTCRLRHGSWTFVHEGPPTADGRRRQVSRGGFPSQREAREAMQASMARAQQGGPAIDQRVTVGAYLQEWLDGKAGLRATTMKDYRSIVDLYVRPGIGHVRLVDLREGHLEQLYAALATLGRVQASPDPLVERLLAARSTTVRRPLSATSIRRVHRCLRAALNAAVKRRRLIANPALHVELAPLRKVRAVVWTDERVEHWRRTGEKPPVAVWTPEQAGAFLDSADDDPLYPLLHLVAYRGLRRGEVVGLRWVDVDLPRARARIAQQIVETDWRVTHVGEPKTSNGIRTITLDARTVEVLREQRDRQAAARETAGPAWTESGLVFTDDGGAHLPPHAVTDGFQRLVAAADLPPIRLHDLRHTAASLALQAGVPLKVVSEQLGHSSLAFTADTYTSVLPAVAEAAAEAVAGVVPRAPRGAAVSTPLTSEPDQEV